jgi:hypothetical protein
MDKIIKYIRYFESNWLNVDDKPLPKDIGKIYCFNLDYVSIGQRIARKLNENKFILGASDHLYINFTTLLEENKIEISNRKPEWWI